MLSEKNFVVAQGEERFVWGDGEMGLKIAWCFG